jgi:TonB family protein
MQAVRIRVRGGSSDELAVIAQRAQAFTHASGTAIALSEGNAAEIICRARAGSSAPEVGTALRVEGTFTGLCIQSGKELRCDDAETDPRVDQAAIRALGIRSMVAIPIKEEGRVVGVLAVFAPTAHAFRITHVVVLKTLADQIAAYLRRKQHDEPYSPKPLPAPPVAASATASPAPSAPVVIKPAEPASTHRQLPVVPNVEPVWAATLAEEIDPAPFSKKQKRNAPDQLESKTAFRAAFRTLDAAAESENRPRANALMIGAAAVVVIAVAVGITLRGPAATPQPALETSSSPATGAAPAPASASAQPPPKNSPLGPPVKHEEAEPKRKEVRPKREETVLLSARPSRISLPQPANSARAGDRAGARDNSAPASDAPVILPGSVPAGSLSNLAGPVAQPPHPRLLTKSELEPVTVIRKVPPVYPLAAKQQKVSASVVVQGTVNKNGKISDLQLISGPPLFRDAAFAAVKQWVFKPARLNGQAIEQSTRIRLEFGAR